MATKQTLHWLVSAYADLKSIQYLLNDEFLTHIVAFHSQQTVEKIFKSLLVEIGQNVPKIHKLQTLADRVEHDIKVDDEVIMILDELYVDSRYPEDTGLLPDGKPSTKRAKEFYAYSKSLFDEACAILQIDIEKVTHDRS